MKHLKLFESFKKFYFDSIDEMEVENPIYRWSVFISPKITRISESNQNDSTLLIVDVQKSFKKWFTEKYVNELKKYASQFTNVYQIWDNHVDGKNVDKDYLYDRNPKVPVHNDLYTFPNQKDLIEKRYNYNVNADFYRKILDKEVYQEIINRENRKELKKGDIFPTKEGTYIVYVGNNHKWHHLSKKLYDLLVSLKNKTVTIVGGSDSECLEDIYTAALSLGVKIKRDWKFIYTSTSCPIK